MSHRKRVLVFLVALVAAYCGPSVGVALAEPGKITLDRPGDREFVRDEAHLLTPAEIAKITQIGDKLLTEKATPIIVVTIDKMANHGGEGMRIETFANLLFDQWAVGVAKVNGQDWNTGILLLVSKGDRKARIELGDHWRHDQDKLAQQIMSEQIVPRFKQGDFPGGILAGVEALDKMARGLTLPAPAHSSTGSTGGASGPPQWLVIVLGIVGIVTIISLIRSGSGGWAWIGWGLLFGLIGTILYQMLSNSSSNSSGGGYSGGGFDGGFSGGGGATGDW
ncbi:MAG: TPM domain-containing protein [Planctomycetia bacterium]|nr:TPM domain-containing protein [Planctomycetia bacterium]